MQININDHFTYKNIFKFTYSPILMMVFISLYSVVDGFFISNYAGLDEYAGVNVIMPIIMVIGGVGFMFGTGGSALTGKYLGEKNQLRANQIFTMIIKVTAIVGLTISVLGVLLIEPIASALGSINGKATDKMVSEAIKYGRTLCFGQTFFMLQNVFQSFLVLDGKPKLGFKYTLYAGLTNMVFDYLFIKVFSFGVIGAAIATIMGYIVGSLFPLVHFLKHKKVGNIEFTKTKIEIKPILKCCYNGMSEFVQNISSSLVGLVYNIQLLKYYGQVGVSAYGTIMYVGFIFVAIYIGYAIGMAPIVSYNYGAKNKLELNSILKKSAVIIGIFAITMYILCLTLGPVFSKIYVGEDPEILSVTIMAFKIIALHYLLCGFSIFLSSFFTALNNGLISAIISFLRTVVFQILSIIFLPMIFGKDAIWWAVNIAEILAFALSFIFLFANNKKYGYFPKMR